MGFGRFASSTLGCTVPRFQRWPAFLISSATAKANMDKSDEEWPGAARWRGQNRGGGKPQGRSLCAGNQIFAGDSHQNGQKSGTRIKASTKTSKLRYPPTRA
jgi:hypothetical protein